MRCKLGFIGLGHMGSAILESIISNKFMDFGQIALYTKNKATLKKYDEQGFAICENIEELCKISDMILLGVKPQSLDEAVLEMKNYKGVLISILAGVKIKTLEQHFEKIIRVMPNLPLTINKGAAAISCGKNISKQELDFALRLFECSSKVELIDEKFMDIIITVNGSTPAYVYYFIDILIEDAVKRGIDYDVAKNLITETFIGSAMILQNSDKAIENHIDAVCSKGGTTIEAINTMKENNIAQIIKKANDNCINRAIELGKRN